MQETALEIVKEAARAFAKLHKEGGWRTGWYTAAFTADDPSSQPGKVTPEDFADFGGVASTWVRRYRKAWDDAAADRLVLHSSEIAVGQEVVLPDDEGGQLWRDYYKSQSGMRIKDPERQRRLEEVAKERGVGWSKVRDVASNPKAMMVAIIADAKSAEAAREALREFDRAKATERAAARASRVADHPQYWEADGFVDRLHALLVDIEQEARTVWDDDVRRRQADRLETHRHTVPMLIDMLRGLDDSALISLLAEEGR